MKPFFLRAATALVACTIASTALAGPLWGGAFVDPANADVIVRCPIDSLSSPAARERGNWAVQCNVVTKRWKTLFNYELNDDGLSTLRAHPLYPSFGVANPITHYLPIWAPNLAKDANGNFTDCSIPSSVTWVATCTADQTRDWAGSQLSPTNAAAAALCNAEVPTAGEVAAVDDWATACGVVAKKWKTLFSYEIDDNGNTVRRQNPLYPVFAKDDPASQFRPIWHPNVAKDAAGSYVSCSVPPQVTWAATCQSNVTSPHGPRIDGPQLDAAQGASRCAGFDQISAEEAADRDAWAIACDAVASRWMTSLLYDDSAYLTPRAKPLYPTFGNAQRVWHPDRTRDANGQFVSCAIPSGITWVGTCTSN